MKKFLILFVLPIFFGSCSVLVYNTGMAKANLYKSERLDEKLNRLTSKREVIVEFGPADKKEFEDGLEFWYYIDRISQLIPARSSTVVTVDDDVAKGNSNHTPAVLRETQETIMFIFDGEKVLKYTTDNVQLLTESNKVRDEIVSDTRALTVLAACADLMGLLVGIMIATDN